MSLFSVCAVLVCVINLVSSKVGFVSAFCCPGVLGQFSRGGVGADVTETGWGLLVVRGEALGSWGFECSMGGQNI